MSNPSARLQRFRPYSVPVCLFTLVAAAALFVPPLILDLSPRTYAITAAVLVLAVTSAFPYAVAVGVGTLPLLYAGAGSYASPQATRGAPSASTALRHVGAGVAYVLAAAAVGAIGLGAEFAAPSGQSALPAALRPSFMIVGSGVVAAAFVGLQLWRYEGPVGRLEARAVAGTVALGLLLVPAARVALWVFGDAGPL
ncbi:hypothetical protein [Natronomonas marina]|uniref:hypothetical protein n=1 Tax=Natronomonas marina TaxID=2961939 RepID=UPI0020C99D64|nr:hypothetical protein [Natronomonas marina]